MTAICDPTLGVEVAWERVWTGAEIDEVLIPALDDLGHKKIKPRRLPRADKAGLAAAFIANRELDNELTELSRRCGLLVLRNESQPEALTDYLTSIVKREKRPGMVGDFAHISLTSLVHYCALGLDIKGYGTCLLETEAGSRLDDVIGDFAATGTVDKILLLHVSLVSADDASEIEGVGLDVREEAQVRGFGDLLDELSAEVGDLEATVTARVYQVVQKDAA